MLLKQEHSIFLGRTSKCDEVDAGRIKIFFETLIPKKLNFDSEQS